MEKKVKILVACHKPSQLPDNEMLFPIHVGAAASSLNLGIQRDDEGENISDKNYCYCELTAMYWAWKNLKDVDVIGLCHYRRYFDFHKQCTSFLPASSFPISALDKLNFSVNDAIVSKVCQGSVVVCKALNLNTTLKLHYCDNHYSDDYRMLETVVDKMQNNNYKKAFEKVISKGYKLAPYNMMLMSRNLYDDYCTWLFGVLAIVEERIEICNYSTYQKRVFGFMAERLLNVWLEAKGIEVIEKPLMFIEEKKSVPLPRRFAFRKTMKCFFESFKCLIINKLYNITPQ